MKVPGLLLMVMSLGGCFVAPPYVFAPEPEPTQPLADGGSSGPSDAGSAAQADAGSAPQTDAGDPMADTRPAADPSCPLDARENDDTISQASRQPSSAHVIGNGPTKYTGMTACLEDEDWFVTWSDPGVHEPLGAVVRWDPTVGPLEVDVLDGRGVLIPLDAPGDIVERRPGEVRLLSKKTGISLLVRVRASGGVSVPYTADIYSPFLLH